MLPVSRPFLSLPFTGYNSGEKLRDSDRSRISESKRFYNYVCNQPMSPYRTSADDMKLPS